MRKVLLTSLCLLTAIALFGQEGEVAKEESPAITFSGSIDAYYRSSTEAPGTSFANLPGFSLGMANLVGAYEGDKVGFVADLVFGPRGEDATFLSSTLRPGGSSNIINQLYAYLNVGDAVKFTLGNFNTFLGYEVIQPTANFNYSTSYMFSYGPFSHTGLKMDADFGNGLSLMLGVFNPTDATEYNPTNDYYGGAQLGYSFDAGSAYVNALFGDGYFQVDLTAGYNITELIYLGLNATTASDDLFAGIAGYFQVATSDALKLGARVESFTDKGVGVIVGDDFMGDESVLALTLSANYTVDNLTLIPELRLDSASADIFEGGTEGSLSSFVLAAVYGF